MNPLETFHLTPGKSAAFAGGCLALAWLLCVAGSAPAQTAPAPAATNAPAEAAAVSGTNSAAADVAAALRAARAARAGVAASETNAFSATNEIAKASGDKSDSSDEIQLSFQNTPIDMIVQWLMQTTGKSVMKNQQVQGNVTISSAKKIPKREAVNLVYRALSLDGISAIETPNYIMLVRENQEPKMSPELLSNVETNVPEGRQRLLKIFTLSHAQASDLRDRIRMVLSEKATVEADDRANQLYVTDYNDNLRMLGELIKALDVTTSSDITLQVYPLKFAEAEEIGNLISMILNAQSPPPPSPSPSRPSGGGSSRPSGSSSVTVIGGMPPDFGSSSSASGGGGGASASAVPPTQQTRIWPDKTNNRLIVSAPKSKLPEVERLIGILDTNKPEDVAVRVLPLKHVSALDVVKEISPLYQKMSGKSLKEIIEVAADDLSNSLIILSSEVNFKAIEKLVAALDTEDAQEKTMRTFTLKNADAEDVAKQLQDLNQDQGPTRYIYIYGSQPGGRSKKMNIVADRRRNAVIVQAPPAQIDDIARMIEELDSPVDDASLAPKIFRLKYVSATDVEDVLNELFLKKQQQRSYYDLIYEEIYGSGSSSSGEGNVGRLYGKVRITSEPYANVLIVTANSVENLAVVENIINELDAPSEAGDSTLRVGLNYAKADSVARKLNILFARNGSPLIRAPGQQQPNVPNPAQQQQQPQTFGQTGFDLGQEAREEEYYPWLGGTPDTARGTTGRSTVRPVSDLIDRVRIVPDQRGNAVIVSANVHFFPQILKLISAMDSPSDQVLIEARIVEVSSDFMDKLGVRWAPSGSQIFSQDDIDNAFIAHVNQEYQKGFGGNTRVNTPPLSSDTVSQVLTSLRSGVVSSTINIDFLVQFLRKVTDASVLGNPQISIADNETGKLFVGQEIPFITRSQFTDVGGQNQSFDYKQVGVILEVTPHINSSGEVQLRIHAESSSVVPGQTLFGGAILDTRQFRTELTARDGETRVLGGIIQRQVSDTLRKTPILGDVPGLRWAFRKKDKTTREVELLVFLRPKVVRSSEDARELMQEMDKKAPLVKKWQEDNAPKSEGQKEQKKK